MSLDTYTNLKIEIADHLDRDNDSTIDTFIDLAEARHKREVRIREMLARSTLDISTRYVTLPDDFLEMKGMRLLTDPVTILNEVNFYEISRVRSESSGKPTYFTVHEEIELDRTPDQTYTLEHVYYFSLTALSSSNETNAILTKAPDLYLYGALLSAAPYLMNDERIQTWNSLYISALSLVNGMDRKRAGPLVSKVVGATP